MTVLYPMRLNFESDGVDAASDTGQSLNSSPSIEDRPSIEITEVFIHQDKSSTSSISKISVNSGASGGSGGAYFSRTTARTEAEVLAKQVVVPKDKRGKPGSKERGIYYSAATDALTLEFGAARHFVPKSWEGEPNTNSNYHNIQEMYVVNLHKLRGVLERTIKYDMRDPFRIPSIIDPITADASSRWGDSTTSRDMLQHWSQITLDETKAFQRNKIFLRRKRTWPARTG